MLGTLTFQAIMDGCADPASSEGKPGKSWPLTMMFVTCAWATTRDGRALKSVKAVAVMIDLVEIVIFGAILNE